MPLTVTSTVVGTWPPRRPVNGSLVWWLRCFGIVTFAVALMRLPSSQQAQVAEIDLRWLGLCMLTTVLQMLLEAFVWHWLLSMQRIRHPYPKTLLAYLASQYLGLVTPGHVGEFLAAGYISMDTGITVGYALSSVVMKKILAWLTILGFGVWGLPLLTTVPFLQGVRKIAWIALLVLLVLSIGIGLWVVSLRRLAKKWQKFSPWQVDMTEFRSGLRHLVSPNLAMPLILSVISFSLLFVQLDLVLHAVGIGLPFLLVARIVAISRFAARLVPFSVMGFGSKDAAVILLLTQQGVALPLAMTVIGLLMMCTYLLTLLVSGLCWWVNPLIVRRAQAPSS